MIMWTVKQFKPQLMRSDQWSLLEEAKNVMYPTYLIKCTYLPMCQWSILPAPHGASQLVGNLPPLAILSSRTWSLSVKGENKSVVLTFSPPWDPLLLMLKPNNIEFPCEELYYGGGSVCMQGRQVRQVRQVRGERRRALSVSLREPSVLLLSSCQVARTGTCAVTESHSTTTSCEHIYSCAHALCSSQWQSLAQHFTPQFVSSALQRHMCSSCGLCLSVAQTHVHFFCSQCVRTKQLTSLKLWVISVKQSLVAFYSTVRVNCQVPRSYRHMYVIFFRSVLSVCQHGLSLWSCQWSLTVLLHNSLSTSSLFAQAHVSSCALHSLCISEVCLSTFQLSVMSLCQRVLLHTYRSMSSTLVSQQHAHVLSCSLHVVESFTAIASPGVKLSSRPSLQWSDRSCFNTSVSIFPTCSYLSNLQSLLLRGKGPCLLQHAW